MQKRTFIRIMIDNLFVNNAFCKAVIALVNFCNEQSYYGKRELKFLKKMPLNKIRQENNYKTKFIFNTTHKTGVDLR